MFTFTPVTIRARLIGLVLAVLLPGLVGGVWVVLTTMRAEHEGHQRTLRDTSRALLSMVESELARRATVAQVLAQSGPLDQGAGLSSAALRAFDEQARRAVQGLDGWVELHAPGRVLLDTRRPVGAELLAEPRAGLSAVAEVLPLRRDAPGSAHAALLAPVQREGATVLNVLVTLRPGELQRIVEAQRLPPDWVATVLDSNGVVVARHPGGGHVGRLATPLMLDRLARRQEGLFDAMTLDGHSSTAYNYFSPAGWSFIAGMPRQEFAVVLPFTLAQIVFGGLVLLGLAVAGAMRLAQRIVEPVLALKQVAGQLQAGHAVAARSTGIVELDAVAQALEEASHTLGQGRNELQRQVAAAVASTRLAEQHISQGQRIQALGRLTGGVAHDFNNLLGVISNSAYLIQRQAGTLPGLQLPVAATLRAVEVGTRLTQHLLRVAGQRDLRPRQLLLNQFLPELEELLRSVLGRHIALSVKVAPGIHAVHVDAGELELALINLALNARDAMPAGGELRLRARNVTAAHARNDGEGQDDSVPPAAPHAAVPADNDSGNVNVNVNDSTGWVEIAVGDSGPGMPSELAASVFEPFFTTKPVGKGTGLGLSQVHGFCTQAGGLARIASTPGVGTTVLLLLPASCTVMKPADEPPPRSAAPAPVAPPSLAGACVLLVEDNTELGDVTAALLKIHGATVERAADAAEALQLLDSSLPVDLVLSDVVMPGAMDGLALARQLRRERPQLPVLLISAYVATADAARDFVILPKPADPAQLLAALRRALAERCGPAAA